jgi:hypothetical protein
VLKEKGLEFANSIRSFSCPSSRRPFCDCLAPEIWVRNTVGKQRQESMNPA